MPKPRLMDLNKLISTRNGSADLLSNMSRNIHSLDDLELRILCAEMTLNLARSAMEDMADMHHSGAIPQQRMDQTLPTRTATVIKNMQMESALQDMMLIHVTMLAQHEMKTSTIN